MLIVNNVRLDRRLGDGVAGVGGRGGVTGVGRAGDGEQVRVLDGGQRGGGGQAADKGREFGRIKADRWDTERFELEEWRLRSGEAKAQGAECEAGLTQIVRERKLRTNRRNGG